MLKDDINRLIDPPPPDVRLDPAKTPKPIRSLTGLDPMRRGGGTGGGNIASPLTETSAAARTYHAGVYITTTDGLFAWPAVHTLTFKDANNSEVKINFASPAP